MTIGKKLSLSAAVILSAMAGASSSTLYSLKRLGGELDNSTGPVATKLALAGNLKAGANGMRTGQRGLLMNALQHDARGLESTRKDYRALSGGLGLDCRDQTTAGPGARKSRHGEFGGERTRARGVV